MMTPQQGESYERRLLCERPKYIPMKPEELAKLSPEERQEYENSLKITTVKHLNDMPSKVDHINFVFL